MSTGKSGDPQRIPLYGPNQSDVSARGVTRAMDCLSTQLQGNSPFTRQASATRLIAIVYAAVR
jgi:hypothetical protein